ncbi:hypothetical protein SAMN05414139_05269 [Burkholderia sp. D7]|nr:hypothetical protein SAMN05414139_05269 [Burkholderia sp. D7]
MSAQLAALAGSQTMLTSLKLPCVDATRIAVSMTICFIKSSGWPTAPFKPHFKR